MKTLPTEQEFLLSQGIKEEHLKNLPWFDFGNLLTWLEDYSIMKAKYHVTKALEAADNNAELEIVDWECESIDQPSTPIYGVDSDSILNAYPLSNIK